MGDKHGAYQRTLAEKRRQCPFPTSPHCTHTCDRTGHTCIIVCRALGRFTPWLTGARQDFQLLVPPFLLLPTPLPISYYLLSYGHRPHFQ